ncbi:MAG: N-acetyltransferase [Emcibacteraceae bacterium]|nr:N-acetyltransferase [Emcibacteraceae bacterium]
MTDIIIRPSLETDIEAIYDIYEYEVLHGTATFDETPPSKLELLAKRESIIKLGFPHMVAEVEDEVVAYSYVSPYRERSAYSKTVENAIYVNPNKRLSGVGFKLMEANLVECEKLGLKNIIAVIGDSENMGSIKLHKKLGFRKIGTMRDVGFKFGRWLDVVLMQKVIG